jgi:Type I phosphodiesterase / nucleotide pyrophosphatase
LNASGSFAGIPDAVRARVRDGERVLLIVLDAFGLEFLHRHARHPLVQRLRVTPLRAQFPSTTTAEMTTLFFGMPVEQHGLYEWNILEPSLPAIICPLRYTMAGSREEGELADRLPFAALAPGPTFYEQLGARSLLLLQSTIAGSRYSQMAARGATVEPYTELAAGVRAALDALSGSGYGHAFLYWDEIDAIGHHDGPSSTHFAAACISALNSLSAALASASREITVLICADHGQIDVDPAAVDYLDDLWPELPEHLSHARPAGSSRDVFLHVKSDDLELVKRELSARLGDRAEVRRARDLFTDPGPRLAERLGDLAILPGPGRQAWMRAARANERWFRGQHGGLQPAETETYIAELLA